jgi:hypothetical protein
MTLTAEVANNTWNYNISGTATPVGGGAAQPISGTATAKVISMTFNSNTVPAFQIVSNISVNGGPSTPVTVTYYFQQDGNNDIIELGQSHTDSSGTTTKTVTAPSQANSEIFPGTFSNGETVTETINFTDTTSENYELVIGSPARENTPAGTFNTWPATITIGGVANGTQFWDPAIGFFVAGNIITVSEVGATTYSLNISYSLTSTNVSPG